MYQSLSTALKCLNENQESMIKWINYLITQNRFVYISTMPML